MNNASQETTTETKQLSLMDDDISQSDYERLRAGEKVEVEVKSETVAQDAIIESEDDDSETSQTDGEEDDDSDSDESELSAKDKEGHKKPKRGFKKRIDKLNAKLSQAEAELEHWRQQALRVQKPDEKQEATQVTKTADVKGEPDPDDYETSTEFYRAHAKWAALEEIKAAKESERHEALRLEAESKKTAFLGKVDEFKKAHDDFEETIADVDDIQMSPAVSQAILESDNGPELMYELAKDREEYARMCALSPFEAARALGRFEARLQKPSVEKTKEVKTKTTKAPPPPKPISTSSANGKKSLQEVAESGSQADYERMRSEQEKRRALNY
jgi:hypothetical protein